MGTILASKIATDAAQILFDIGYDRIFEADHLKYINAGQRQAVILKPDISVTTSAIVLIAGTKQAISDTAMSLVRLTRNMGTTGTVPGRTCHLFDMDLYSKINMDWHTDAADAVVRMYAYDPRDPRVFYVYPPQPAASQGYVERTEVIIPTDIAAIGSAITLDDIYETALMHYDLFRCFTIDAKHSAQADAKAVFHYGMFTQIMTGKEMSETAVEPRE